MERAMVRDEREGESGREGIWNVRERESDGGGREMEGESD